MAAFVDKFWSKVARGASEACWPWRAYCNRDGYGVVGYHGKNQRAHRLAYLFTVGDPGDRCVLHRCDNPPCCNPAHLFLGTHLENIADRINKGRTRTGIGSRHGRAKLDEKQVSQLLKRRGESRTALAVEYGVSKATIDKVMRRELWRHVPEPRAA